MAFPSDLEIARGAALKPLEDIGDAHTPCLIAQAVLFGHRLAREIDSPYPDVPLPFIRERRLAGATEADYRPGAAALLPFAAVRRASLTV